MWGSIRIENGYETLLSVYDRAESTPGGDGCDAGVKRVSLPRFLDERPVAGGVDETVDIAERAEGDLGR